MGSASSREIREIVDEAVVALRSGQRSREVMGDVIDVSEGGVVFDHGGGGDGGVVYYGDGDESFTDSDDDESSSESGESGCESCCEWESECCYETVECCCAGGGGGCCGERRGRRGREKKKEKKKKKEKGVGFWAKCYPVRGEGDWGGSVVGITRCPGEVCVPTANPMVFFSDVLEKQDPKRWGFKLGTSATREAPEFFTTTRRDPCEHAAGRRPVRDARSRSRQHHRHHHHSRSRSRRPDDREACYRRDEDRYAPPPNRGRRRTLVFDEFDASPPPPRGYYYQQHRRGDAPTRYYRRSSRPRYDEGRRRREEEEELMMMHGALRDGRHAAGRRARSWERRSDGDERVGEIDDRTEDSYALGERGVVVARGVDGRRRNVRFERL